MHLAEARLVLDQEQENWPDYLHKKQEIDQFNLNLKEEQDKIMYHKRLKQARDQNMVQLLTIVKQWLDDLEADFLLQVVIFHDLNVSTFVFYRSLSDKIT